MLFLGYSCGLFFCTYSSPLKIDMEHNHGGLEDHFPFYSWVICRFQPLIFQGVLNGVGVPGDSIRDLFWDGEVIWPFWGVEWSDTFITLCISKFGPLLLIRSQLIWDDNIASHHPPRWHLVVKLLTDCPLTLGFSFALASWCGLLLATMRDIFWK